MSEESVRREAAWRGRTSAVGTFSLKKGEATCAESAVRKACSFCTAKKVPVCAFLFVLVSYSAAIAFPFRVAKIASNFWVDFVARSLLEPPASASVPSALALPATASVPSALALPATASVPSATAPRAGAASMQSRNETLPFNGFCAFAFVKFTVQ
jgi:hypothetical protein